MKVAIVVEAQNLSLERLGANDTWLAAVMCVSTGEQAEQAVVINLGGVEVELADRRQAFIQDALLSGGNGLVEWSEERVSPLCGADAVEMERGRRRVADCRLSARVGLVWWRERGNGGVRSDRVVGPRWRLGEFLHVTRAAVAVGWEPFGVIGVGVDGTHRYAGVDGFGTGELLGGGLREASEQGRAYRGAGGAEGVGKLASHLGPAEEKVVREQIASGNPGGVAAEVGKAGRERLVDLERESGA